jgi:hypothetical protein
MCVDEAPVRMIGKRQPLALLRRRESRSLKSSSGLSLSSQGRCVLDLDVADEKRSASRRPSSAPGECLIRGPRRQAERPAAQQAADHQIS